MPWFRNLFDSFLKGSKKEETRAGCLTSAPGFQREESKDHSKAFFYTFQDSVPEHKSRQRLNTVYRSAFAGIMPSDTSEMSVAYGKHLIRAHKVSCGSEGVSWASLGQAGLTPSSGSGSSLLHKSSFQNPGRRSSYHLQQDLFTAQTGAPRGLLGACEVS